MNDTLTTYSAHLDSHEPKVNRLLSTPLVIHRKNLADPKKPNPFTKVAQRLAEPETVEDYLTQEIGGPIHDAGMQFLAGIHEEIDKTPIHEVTRAAAANQQDALTGILLTYLSRFEHDEEEARQQEREEQDKALQP